MATIMLAFSSCEDELDIAKHGNLGSMDDFYTTDENVEQASASMYLELRGNYCNWFFLKNLLSDDVWTGGGSRGDNGEMAEHLQRYCNRSHYPRGTGGDRHQRLL